LRILPHPENPVWGAGFSGLSRIYRSKAGFSGLWGFSGLVDCVYGIIQLVQSYGCKTRGWNTVCLCIEFYSNPANPVIGAGFSGLWGFPGLGLDVFVIVRSV
jgi:hypothetical protein